MRALFGPTVFAVSLTLLLLAAAGAWGTRAVDPVDELAKAAACVDPERPLDSRHEREAARLLDRWAPTFVQHVARDDAGRDRPTRIDFDGDWDTTNNWDHQAEFGTDLPPAVYGAAVLTETHAYLTYTLYYPRDWIRPFCLPYICHDNDLENVLVVVERDGGLVLIETKAHFRYHELTADELATDDDGRPLVMVEAMGHGPRPCGPGDDVCEPRLGRLVYARGDEPSPPPREADGRRVDYELIPLRDSLWARRHIAEDTLGLWEPGETGPLVYAGERCGRVGGALGASMAGKRYPGGVRPPWGLRGQSGARGDWFLDPAAVSAARHPHLAAAGPGAFDYVFHPYLKDLARECVGDSCRPYTPPPEPSRAGTWVGFGAVAGLLAFALLRANARLVRYAPRRSRGR